MTDGLGVFVLVAAASIAGGTIKGVVGIGLPLVTIPVVSTVVPTSLAVTIMAPTALVTNIVQAVQGGGVRAASRAFWFVYLALLPGATLGVLALTHVDPSKIDILVGAILLAFVGLSRSGARPATAMPSRRRYLGGVAAGFGSGVTCGIAGLVGPPVAIYLAALRVDRATFISGMALTYIVGMVPVQAGLVLSARVSVATVAASSVALGGAILGYWIGARLRHRISQELFRRSLFWVLGLIGAVLVARGVATLTPGN